MTKRTPPSGASAAPDFPAGGGEMGALIRAKDWSRTPLGPSESWSPVLRTMVPFLLANRFPLLLWWGPEYISIYNDAYRPVLGTKHPQALGQPVEECWREIWPVLQPLIDRPFHGGAPTWNEDLALEINRHGFLEETHFTVAYSPVPDESVPSGIGGVLATVHEISEKVVGERRIGVLRDLGSQAARAATAEDACVLAAETLAKYPKDIPFALFYLLDRGREQARLAAASGLEPGGVASPLALELAHAEPARGTWPLAQAVESEALEVVDDLPERFPETELPGPWSEPPRRAVVAPIRSNIAHQLAGLLVIGISPRLRLDESYRSFIELAASQVATAIANARAYEEERRRAEALAELDRAKTAFFSNVSHEFRTPLTLMLGPLEDSLARAELPAEERGRIEVAHRNALRLLRLVNTLLDFSRLEDGRMEASYAPTDLAAFTAELASVFRSAIERAGLRLVVDCPPLGEDFFVDREMWEKIVLNLLSNAFKFTFAGEIEVSLQRAGAGAELTVRDTGTGIPPDEIPHLFERFHRVKGARGRSFEGSGIGLALVQELARLHGGAVRVESELERGSRFVVSIPRGREHLPAARVEAPRTLASTGLGGDAFVEEAARWLSGPASSAELAGAAGRTRAEEPSPAGSAPRARIVLADDNADMRDYVRRLLEPHYEVEAVADGVAALRAARERPADLLLADVMMPRLDGFGVLREVRSDDGLANVPVVLLSARAGEEARVEGMDAGADDYLVKPFSARELLARVGAHLRLSRARREAEAALRESEAKFSTAFANSPLALTISRVSDGRLIEVNEGFVRLSGYTREEALGRTPDELGLWVDPGVRAEGLARMRGGEPLPPAEARFRTKSGRVLTGEVGAALVGIGGQPCILSSVSDLTGRLRAEEELRESEERLRAMFDSTVAGCALLTPDGRFLRVNEAFSRITGRSYDELVVLDLAALTHPDDAPELDQRLTRLLAGEIHSFVLEMRYVRKDGGLVWVDNGVSLTRGPAGEPLQLVVVGQDVSERKQVEERLAVEAAAMQRLSETSTLLVLQDDARAIYEQILDAAVAIMASDFASLQLLHEARGELELLGQRGFSAEAARFFGWVRSDSKCACGEALRTRERVLVPDVETCAFMSGSDLAASRETGIRAVQTTPLVSRDGRLVGMLSTHWRRPHQPSERDLRLFDVLARQAADLIERSNAQLALRVSEERFRQMAEVSPQFIWVIGADGSLEYVNERWIDYSGLDFARSAAPDPMQAAIHPEDRAATLTGWQHAVDAAQPFETEVRLRRHDGVFRWFLTRAVPIRDDTGAVSRWLASSTDIDQQKQAEADIWFLAELGERIQVSEDAADLIADVVQAVGHYLGVTRCFFAEVSEDGTRWIVHPDHHSALASIAGEYPLASWNSDGVPDLRSGRVRVFEDTEHDPRAAPRYATRYGPLSARAIVTVPLHLGERRVSHLSVASDQPRHWLPREIALLEAIGERTWNAVEKLRLDAALRESEARFRTMADNAPVMVWVSEPDLRCTFLSRSWYEFTGETPETGLELGWLAALHPEDRATAERTFREANALREPFRLELRLRRADGEYRWAINAAAPRRSPKGAFLGYIGSVIDITERRTAEEALRASDRRKDEFLAMLAHELRNPLAPIRNAAHVLKLVGPTEAEQQWAREVIERQTQHLTRLVDDLLDVSRITQGKVVLQREPLELAAILTRAVEIARPLADARKQQLYVGLPPETLQVEGDLTRLVQVVGNLLNNATKYTEDGGHIRLEARAEGREAVIRVRDDGMGLPPELLPHVFDLFRQADRSLDRSQGGLGIGLTLVRSLVELHGGSVEAKSEGLGRGSEFVVRLPALEAGARARKHASRRREHAAARPLRVLVVEDHADAAEMMAFLLKLAGHEVRTANDGPAAVGLARAFQPQVVLCDIGLPGMTGYEVAVALRQEPELRGTRLIALSGYGQPEDRRRSKAAGFDYHLTKPVEPSALHALLDSLRDGTR